MSSSYRYGRCTVSIDKQTDIKAQRIATNHLSKFVKMGAYFFSTDDRGEVKNKAEQEAVFADLRAAGLYELMYPGGE